MVHVLQREDVSVPDGLTTGNIPPSVPDFLHPGPPSQLIPFTWFFMSPRQRSIGALQLTRAVPAVPPLPSTEVDPIGFVVIRPDAGNPQTASQ